MTHAGHHAWKGLRTCALSLTRVCLVPCGIFRTLTWVKFNDSGSVLFWVESVLGRKQVTGAVIVIVNWFNLNVQSHGVVSRQLRDSLVEHCRRLR